MSCPSCEIRVTKNLTGLHCRTCDKWYHYSCTKLPTYFIVLLINSQRTFVFETCISTKHEAVFLRDYAVIEESISKHDEARINPNDISDDDMPIDSDTSLSLSVGLNEMPITTDTQPKDNENCDQIDAPNQNITDANPQNANTTNPVDGKNQRQNTNDGNPKQNNTNPVTVNSFVQTDSIELKCTSYFLMLPKHSTKLLSMCYSMNCEIGQCVLVLSSYCILCILINHVV